VFWHLELLWSWCREDTMTHPVFLVPPLTFVDRPRAAQAIHWYMMFSFCIKELSRCCHSRSHLVDLRHTRLIQWCVLKVLLHLPRIHAVVCLPWHSQEWQGVPLQYWRGSSIRQTIIVHGWWFHILMVHVFSWFTWYLVTGGSLEAREHGSLHPSLTGWLGRWMAES